MMKAYSQQFRNELILKLNTPGGPTAKQLAARTGVPRGTLYRWRLEAVRLPARLPAVTQDDDNDALPLPSEARKPQDWPAEEKLRLVREASQLDGSELGALLRRQGVHEADLAQWREQVEDGALSALSGKRQRGLEQKRIRKLESELKRKEKALAEAAALLVLSKKMRALWGEDEDDGTSGSSGE